MTVLARTARFVARRLATAVVVLWFVAVCAVGGAAAVAHLTDLEFQVVTTASMTPTIGVDTLAVTGPVDADEVAVGDVVLFTEPRTRAVVMHRVSDVLEQRGVRFFETKGDANPSPDPVLLTGDDLTGTLRADVPQIGAAVRHVASPIGRAAMVGVPLVALVASEVLARRRDQRPVTAAPPAVALTPAIRRAPSADDFVVRLRHPLPDQTRRPTRFHIRSSMARS